MKKNLFFEYFVDIFVGDLELVGNIIRFDFLMCKFYDFLLDYIG